MARTAKMRLIELMVLREDISNVIEYIGKKGTFQFQTQNNSEKKSYEALNIDKEFFEKLKAIKNSLMLELNDVDISECSSPKDEDREQASHLISSYDELAQKIEDATTESEKIHNAYNEALSFSNLKVPYTELEHLSFLSLKIGTISPKDFDDLKEAVGVNGIIIPLGEDKSHILAASSKKNRFALDTELKKFGFVELEIPENFNGVPDDVLTSLKLQKNNIESVLEELNTEKANFAETHKFKVEKLLKTFAIGTQISEVVSTLQSTDMVYRITGWIPSEKSNEYMTELDDLTKSRIAIRIYEPYEVPSVISGKEQVPVKLEHGKFVKSFERMIFSYGAPAYGTIDPTPFVAIFFTFLFGFMFGDFGQGLFISLFGILMGKNIIKVGAWNKFSPIFIAVGLTSAFMGLLTGECFSNETLLEPFQLWITGLFGEPRAPILTLMPSSDPSSIKTMFMVFGVAVAVGFVINSIGLIINIINSFSQHKIGEALFGKTGLSGIIWFWYVVVLIIRIFAFHYSPAAYDWLIIGVTLFFSAFGEPFERLVNGHRPICENGVGAMIIGGVVELIEVISTYLSNSVSFVRVGAFALSHAVLDFLVLTLAEMVPSAATIFVMILGNAIIIVLEGMIVAIQVIRLQYYEFFSKFFKETGKEFKPFEFKY